MCSHFAKRKSPEELYCKNVDDCAKLKHGCGALGLCFLAGVLWVLVLLTWFLWIWHGCCCFCFSCVYVVQSAFFIPKRCCFAEVWISLEAMTVTAKMAFTNAARCCNLSVFVFLKARLSPSFVFFSHTLFFSCSSKKTQLYKITFLILFVCQNRGSFGATLDIPKVTSWTERSSVDPRRGFAASGSCGRFW